MNYTIDKNGIIIPVNPIKLTDEEEMELEWKSVDEKYRFEDELWEELEDEEE